MSMGAKMRTAVLALKAEGRLPPGLGTNELEQLIADKLAEIYGRGRAPSPRTFYRHLGRVRALTEDDGSDCHYQRGFVGLISEAVKPADDEDRDMQAEPRAFLDITQASYQYLLTIPHDHTIDAALQPDYLRNLVGKVKLAPGDGIELRASDYSWVARMLVISVARATRTVTTKLVMAPTFLLGSADRTQEYLIEQINELEHAKQTLKVSDGEYASRLRTLQSLKEHGCYPTAWLRSTLAELDRAQAAGLLTRSQRDRAAEELSALMTEAQVQEIRGAAKPEPVAAPAPTLPAEFTRLKTTDVRPEIREPALGVVAGDPLMKK